MVSATKTEIKRILRTIFPELESLCDPYTRVMLDFLKEFPSARLIKRAPPRRIAKALRRKGVGNKLSFSSEDIIRAAKDSVATVSPAKEVILQGKISTLLHLQERLDEVTKLLTDLCKSMMIKDFEILTSIRGVSTKTAAPFLAEMGSIEKFRSYKKLTAIAGLDPSIHQSGKFIGTSRLSKRGNRHPRRAIYLMTASVVSKNAFFKAYFFKRKREGLPP